MPLLEGCSPDGYEKPVQAKLEYIPKWEGDPEKVLETMAKAPEEWTLVEMDSQDRAKAEDTFYSGQSSRRKTGGKGPTQAEE